MDQHDDGLDAARLQFGDQRIDRLGLVAEFEAGRAVGEMMFRRAFQRKPDEGDRDAFERPDLIGGKHRLAVAFSTCWRRGSELRAEKRCGPGLSTATAFCMRSNSALPRRIRIATAVSRL